MKIVNLTGTDIQIEGQTIPRSGALAQVMTLARRPTSIDGLPVLVREPAGVVNLPPPEPGVAYVVPFPVAVHADVLGRHDVYTVGKYRRSKPGGGPACVGCLDQIVSPA